MESFLHELNMNKRVDFCPRIIRILGINLDESIYYADGGNLRNYFNNHFSDLNWKDHKIKLAYQITEGIKYLHGENIHHQDLHSKNIFRSSCGNYLAVHPQMLTYSLIKVSVPNTPYEYMKLYQSCWNCEPDERPSIEQVFSTILKYS
ncbi:unnamed protein product [Rhizophagus irregularis]|nr:unnamed protein product [Rhizophagus irregularis]